MATAAAAPQSPAADVRIRLGAIEPQDAVAVFAERGLLRPTFRWQDMWHEEHARAFTVAGMQRMDILQLFRSNLEEAVRTGLNPQVFRDRMRAALQKEGWWGDVRVTDPKTGEQRITRFNEARLQLIYDTNLRMSHSAGRWAAIQRTKKLFPYIVYRTMRDEKVRASHRPWDGVVLPVDHPWWHTHWPPNGWRCRCVGYPVSAKDLERMRAAGLPVQTEPPEVQWTEYVNPHTGEVQRVPAGIDPGFAYNPGRVRDAQQFQQVLGKAAKAEPTVGSRVVREAIDRHPALVRASTEEFAQWARQVVASKETTGDVRPIGALHVAAIEALQRQDRAVKSALVVAIDKRVWHAVRDAKVEDRKLTREAVEELPQLIAHVDAILVERQRGAVLYVKAVRDGTRKAVKVVVTLNYELKFRRSLVATNVADTVTIMDPQALRDPVLYELVWGAIP